MKYLQSRIARICISICIAGPVAEVVRLALGGDPNRARMPIVTFILFAVSYIILSSVVKRSQETV